jgi:hypothetical protein
MEGGVSVRDEIQAATDEEAGRFFKQIAAKLGETDEHAAVGWAASTLCLVSMVRTALATNAETVTSTVEGAIYSGKPLGDWEVTIRRIKAPK